jgi:hypothetical protein
MAQVRKKSRVTHVTTPDTHATQLRLNPGVLRAYTTKLSVKASWNHRGSERRG